MFGEWVIWNWDYEWVIGVCFCFCFAVLIRLKVWLIVIRLNYWRRIDKNIVRLGVGKIFMNIEIFRDYDKYKIER